MPGKRISIYKSIFWSFVLVIGSLFFSCANEDCVSIFNNHLLVGFIKTDTLNSGEIIYNELDTLFYSIYAEGNDSLLYAPDTTVSMLTLPVNPAAEFTSFELTMLDSISYDTLNNPTYHINPNPHYIKVSYNRRQRIISEDCGIEITYTKLRVEEITFRDTVVVDDKLSRLNEVNIEVYF